jgi:hypothetical protein
LPHAIAGTYIRPKTRVELGMGYIALRREL